MGEREGIVLKHPQEDEIMLLEGEREVRLRRDTNAGTFTLCGDNWCPTQDPKSPDVPSPWRLHCYDSLEAAVCIYEGQGWKAEPTRFIEQQKREQEQV